MQSHFSHVAMAAAFVVMGAGVAAAQTVIMTEPAETRAVVTRAPLNLTPAQRTTIYRTIVPQGKGRQPIIKERIVTEPVPNATVGARVVPRPGEVEVVTQPRDVEYVVGSRVPATATLAPVPATVAAEVPAVSRYQYMVVDGRLLLVDPVTSTVVAEITN